MASSGSAEDRPNTETIYEDGNGLLLYHFYPSYYSQRVVFALHEKKLPFKSEVVNLLLGEQFEPTFMKLNPKAEVPVLKDGVKVIPDSSRIIDYLEDNFSNGNTPRLKPEKGSAQYQTMENFITLLDKVPVQLITFGCLLNPQLTDKMKLTPEEVKGRVDRYSVHQVMLDEFIEKHKEFSEQYKLKKEALQKSHAASQDIGQVKKSLDMLEEVLDTIEKQLASHGDNEKWWLCGEKFTIADVYVAVLLNRLQVLGLWNRYFGASTRPRLAAYFKRCHQREAYRRTMNPSAGILGSLCCLGNKEKLAVSLGSAMLVLGVVGLTAFLVQRKK